MTYIISPTFGAGDDYAEGEGEQRNASAGSDSGEGVDVVADAGASTNADTTAVGKTGCSHVDGSGSSSTGSSWKELRLVCTNSQRHTLGAPPPARGSITISVID